MVYGERYRRMLMDLLYRKLDEIDIKFDLNKMAPHAMRYAALCNFYVKFPGRVISQNGQFIGPRDLGDY